MCSRAFPIWGKAAKDTLPDSGRDVHDSPGKVCGASAPQLEGLTYEQLPTDESKCRAREVEHGEGFVSLITNLPVTFQYGDQFETLYRSQEATFATPEGDFLVHVLYSQNVEPQTTMMVVAATPSM